MFGVCVCVCDDCVLGAETGSDHDTEIPLSSIRESGSVWILGFGSVPSMGKWDKRDPIELISPL